MVQMYPANKIFIAFIVSLSIFAIIGWGLLIYSHYTYQAAVDMSNLAPVDIRENSLQYKFINPLLFSRTDKSLYVSEFKALNDYLNKYIETTKNTYSASSVSVYFRDLNTSHWTGINEDEKYNPASMLKVAVLMAYLKYSESHPGIFSEKVYYPGSNYKGQYYRSDVSLDSGQLSIEELLRRMIVDSDNIALNVLKDHKSTEFMDTYKDFRLPIPATSTNDFMSARSYSVMFRSLYNSTYLPWDVSESALSLLAQTKFDNGLMAGVPVETVVAHKFGENTQQVDSGLILGRELHDCGIIYYPENPYLLCVMTKGQDYPTLAKVIADISKIVYAYVDTKSRAEGSKK